MGLDISSNVDDVISDIEDVKDDLRDEMRDRVGAVMRTVASDARLYVMRDADTTGNLADAIAFNEHNLTFTVFVDDEQAPYAALVEYGSGERSNVPWDKSVPAELPENPPRGFSYDSPDEDAEQDIYGAIIQWMETKPVEPMTGSIEKSAGLITNTIIDKGYYAHPFMRPAWNDNEQRVRTAAKSAVHEAVR